MPCYTPPMTHGELRSMHEEGAKRICRKIGITFTSGPHAVRRLCAWCRDHTKQRIEAAGARWWYADHEKYDLRESGLAKLTSAEIKALGLRDEDEVA